MTEQEYRISLGAYVLGALEPDETSDVEIHLQTCPGCQLEYLEFAATLGVLGSVSPDVTVAGLAGQPARDELAPWRQARPTARTRHRTGRWRTLAVAVTAAALLGAVSVGAAVTLGRSGSAGGPTAALRASTDLPALRTVNGRNPRTGVTAVVTLRAEPGGTRLDALVTGRLMAGWQCRLVAIPAGARSGESAGSRRVTRPSDGISLDGPVGLPLEEIGRVEIQRADGQVLVSLPL
jgi:anti-sigma factor RsiW